MKSADTDLPLALLPLSRVSLQVATELIDEGLGRVCGECKKPFTAARKWRGVVRLLTLSDSGLAATHYLVCGKCKAACQERQRRKVPALGDGWYEEARRAHACARLLSTPAKGNA